jgi:hypothetical protein
VPFGPSLGDGAFDAVENMLPDGDFTSRAPNASDFADGWYGYVLNDLRDLYSGGNAYSRIYCGDGSASRCRAALRESLRDGWR